MLQNKWTALHMAVRNNCVATIQVLINLGISINAQSNVSKLIIIRICSYVHIAMHHNVSNSSLNSRPVISGCFWRNSENSLFWLQGFQLELL